MLTLASVARVLGGEVIAGGVSFPAPGHAPRDRSGRVLVGSEYPDGFWVKSWCGDDERRLRDHVRSLLGVGMLFQPDEMPIVRPARPTTDQDRADRALALWGEAHHPRETPVEAYLISRGLTLPGEAAGDVVRFHPSCPFAGQRVPAMVALVRDIRTDRPVAIHRTALDGRGRKVTVDGKDRLALGPTAGGAVKLTPDAHVETCLGIGEGIESTLSLRRLPEFGPSPTWALIHAAGISTFPILAGIEALWIAVDHDLAGVRAAAACADRWQATGAETFRVRPCAEKSDLNDLVPR